MKTAVYFIFQPHEARETADFLRRLAPQLGANTLAFGVLNGDDPGVAATLRAVSPWLRIDEPGRNLGVAGGRNCAVASALAWEADVLVSLDNDILFPSDYLLRAVSAYAHLAQQDSVGVCAPALLDYPALSTMRDAEELFNSDCAAVVAELRRQQAQPPAGIFYHLGAVNWYCSYLVTPALVNVARRLLPEVPALQRTYLAHDRDTCVRVWEHGGAVPVDTLPGGAHIMSADVYREVGPFDVALNPFGFEDADLCISARLRGYQNFLLGDLWLAHDLHARARTRDDTVRWATRGKMRALLTRKYLRGAKRSLAQMDALAVQPLDILREPGHTATQRLRHCLSYLRAYAREAAHAHRVSGRRSSRSRL